MNKRRARHFRTRIHRPSVGARAWLCLAIGMALAAGPACARPASDGADAPVVDTADDASSSFDASFDRNLLSGAGQNTSDLSRFERGNVLMPGIYRTDIFLNNAWVGRNDVRFAAPTPDGAAIPCVDKALFLQLGLPLQKLSEQQQASLEGPDACVAIGDLIPAATIAFDQPNLRLDVSVPQAWLGGRARGYVSPENWDQGVPAALLNYNVNSYRSRSGGISQTSTFAGLNAGFNVGAWHVRHDSTFIAQSGSAGNASRHHWQSIDTYVRRDLPSLRAQLTLGDSYTGSDLFDSVSVRGAQLATDDRMLPDSMRGYAPTVRGVAETNAKVTIRQNGIVLYETTVAPGPFVISDLYPTGYGGDLAVSVTEANGRVRTFNVPYASVPQLLRPGLTRFALVAGELHDRSIHAHPGLVQGTLQHGFTNVLTGYGGLVALNGYGAVQVGSALNTRFGALAADLTSARTQIPGQSSQTGQSLRLSYSKILPDTDTSLTVATYRYSTSGYLGLRDALTLRDIARGYQYVDPTTLATVNGVSTSNLLTPEQLAALQGLNPKGFAIYTSQLDRQRSRFDITLNQRLGERGGSFYLTGSAIDYWNRAGTDVQFQAGYNNRFHALSYSISASRTRNAFSGASNQVFLSFTLPLGSSAHAPTFGGNITHDSDGHMLDQLTMNGTLGQDNQFSYGATASHDNGEGPGSSGGNAGTIFGGYRSPYAQLDGSVGSGNGYSQASLGIAGSVVAYRGGVVFGQPSGDTVAIVEAPKAAGARVLNAAGVHVDRFGHALVPYMTPYNLNTVELDPKGLPLSVQLEATSAQVAPHAGSVVVVKFKTESGRAVIVRVRRTDGRPMPFGAEVFDGANRSAGLVGQAGRALLRGLNDSGELSVRWNANDGTPMQCAFPYQLPAQGKHPAQRYETIEAICTPVAAETHS